jgi:hypothetical protein
MLQFMALSVLKGVGSTIFQVEDVRLFFFSLLDCRDRYWNRHISVPILSNYEIQILCLLLEVNTTMLSLCVHADLDTSSNCIAMAHLLPIC